jgi:hypothetical protein
MNFANTLNFRSLDTYTLCVLFVCKVQTQDSQGGGGREFVKKQCRNLAKR